MSVEWLKHRWIAACVGSCLLWAGGVVQAGENSLPPDVRPFLEHYCFECHDSDMHKAGLALDAVPLELSAAASARQWEAVFDKLNAAQMPPKKAEQPKPAERERLLQLLGGALHDASLARQQAQGRVPLRRLSRAQYEDTLRDLLALPALNLKDLLPEESPVGGFDNVSSGQSISGVHLVRYQQAADAALAAAVPARALAPVHINLTGRELMGAPKKQKEFETWKCWLKGEALVIPSKLYRPNTTVATPPAPADGRYRVRVTGYGLHTGGSPLPVVFNYLFSQQLLYGEDLAWRDLPADKPGTVEVELDLRAGQVVDVMGWTLPHRNTVTGKLKGQAGEAWTGPSLAIERLEVDGPLDTWPPESYKRLFGELPLKTRAEVAAEQGRGPMPKPRPQRKADEWQRDPLTPISASPREDAERLVTAFLPRAFRRPVPERLRQHYVSIALELLDEGLPFDEAMVETYKSVLCSPHFLFMEETPGPLDGYALASRLSYFLWNSMPDDTLLTAAAQGDLAHPDVLHAQVERMLADPRVERFTADFAGQWLDLRKIDATTPDMSLYPEFDRILQASSVRETELFFEEILQHNLSLTEFVQSDWTYLNRRLAQHYGIAVDDSLGYELRKVPLPPESHRGGVMTQASVLKVTADGARTSPILRGKWICERMLGVMPPPPPPDIPKIEPDIRGATTIRQQLAKHRSTASCASCHTVIDPPGFALECYDVIGGWREFYRVPPRTGRSVKLANYPERTVSRGLDVEMGDKMPDGRPFKDVEQYKQLLLEDKDALARNLVRKVLTYATGADVQFADREVVEQIVRDLRQKNYGFRAGA